MIQKNFREFYNSPNSADKKFLDDVKTLLAILNVNPDNVWITSAYRTPEENKRVGGVANSLHMSGLAIDLVIPNISPSHIKSVVNSRRDLGLQVIYYPEKKYYHIERDIPAGFFLDKKNNFMPGFTSKSNKNYLLIILFIVLIIFIVVV